jgi:DNA-binding NarL/FixJ family response regulator
MDHLACKILYCPARCTKTLGRLKANDTFTAAVQNLKAEGKSQTEVASKLEIGIAIVKQHVN